MFRNQHKMCGVVKIYILFLIMLNSINANELHNENKVDSRSAFDNKLYEDVLDAAECQRQLEFLDEHPLKFEFLDASASVPIRILTRNWDDLGDYHQCLSIDHAVNNMVIQGKYCAITVPYDQSWTQTPISSVSDRNLLDVEWLISGFNKTPIHNEQNNVIESDARHETRVEKSVDVRINPSPHLDELQFTLGVCVPKVCTASEAIDFVEEKLSLKINHTENFCRLPSDKPFYPADYVAISILSIIGLLLTVSTTIDLVQRFYLNIDLPKTYFLCNLFSVYTNTRRFLTFDGLSVGSLDCVNGVKSLSIIWAIAGHTYFITIISFVHNRDDVVNWMTSWTGILINSATLAGDTFVTLLGIFMVYTVLHKFESMRHFIRNIPLFLFSFFMRLIPMLAIVVLLQASFFNRMSDGPFWSNVAQETENCRSYWWSSLLFIQNQVNSYEVCLTHTWYLSLFVQSLLPMPLLLLSLFRSKRVAWISFTLAISITLALSITSSFTSNYITGLAGRLPDYNHYIKNYYTSTSSRGPPLNIGGLYGYLLFQYRDKKITIPRMVAANMWILCCSMFVFCIFVTYPIMHSDHDIQILDNFVNASTRSIWATAMGWLIFACAQGYGGPINWLLSLPMWKLPARMSYAMFLLHFPIILIVNGSWVQTHYFTHGETMVRFFGIIVITFIFSLILCVCIDSPFITIRRRFITTYRPLKPVPVKEESNQESQQSTDGDRRVTDEDIVTSV